MKKERKTIGVIESEAIRDNTLTNVDLFSEKHGKGNFEKMKEISIGSLEKVSGMQDLKVWFSDECMEFWDTGVENPEDKDVQLISYIELDAVIQSAESMNIIEENNRDPNRELEFIRINKV